MILVWYYRRVAHHSGSFQMSTFLRHREEATHRIDTAITWQGENYMCQTLRCSSCAPTTPDRGVVCLPGSARRSGRVIGEGRSALQTAARTMIGGRVICIGWLYFDLRNLNGQTAGQISETFWHGLLQVPLIQKPGDHPNFRKNALGVKSPFSELWERSGVFSEQLSEFRK